MTGNNERCKKCFIQTYTQLCEKFQISPVAREEFFNFFDNYYMVNCQLTAPEIQRELNQKFSQLIGIQDIYKNEKFENNEYAVQLTNVWEEKLSLNADHFKTTLKLAIAGNIIDYGANNEFNISETIDRVMNSDFAIDHSDVLKNKLKLAHKILYLGDNAGEIVFDKLFIKHNLQNKDVVFAVKSGPILNDVTMDDALQLDMHSVARVISNGYDAPSTILSHCSEEFLSEFHTADVIISKGQGNLEGLLTINDDRIFFLLMVKCNVIAEALKVKKGDFVVVHLSN